MQTLKKYDCIILGILIGLNLNTAMANASATLPYLKVDTSAAVIALLDQAKDYFSAGENEQAAATLERALRIDPRNPVIWHNLAGVRLEQEDWQRAASLAARSNTFVVDNKWLQVRNWVVIGLACEGMGDRQCVQEAKKMAYALAG